MIPSTCSVAFVGQKWCGYTLHLCLDIYWYNIKILQLALISIFIDIDKLIHRNKIDINIYIYIYLYIERERAREREREMQKHWLRHSTSALCHINSPWTKHTVILQRMRYLQQDIKHRFSQPSWLLPWRICICHLSARSSQKKDWMNASDTWMKQMTDMSLQGIRSVISVS